MKIILCITGSIAATEDLKLVHELQRHGYDVECFIHNFLFLSNLLR
jgi:phosphopantothenoylcysteine decarboxylase/phosphopantothenate--cysteine ligase